MTRGDAAGLVIRGAVEHDVPLVLSLIRELAESYRRAGAVPMDEWTVYRLTGEALDRLASEEG